MSCLEMTQFFKFLKANTVIIIENPFKNNWMTLLETKWVTIDWMVLLVTGWITFDWMKLDLNI